MSRRAEEYLVRFEGDRALAAYTEALAVDPQDGAAAAGRVRALWLLGRYRTARYELRRLLVNFPRWPDTHVAAGQVALGQRDDPVFLGVLDGSSDRDTDQARNAFDDALRLDPGCVLAWRGLAASARLDADLEGALALLAKAQSEVSCDPGFLLERAMCARDGGRLGDALTCTRQAIWLAPHCVESRIVEARVLLELGRIHDAAKALDALASAKLDCAPYHLAAALTFHDQIPATGDPSSRNALRSRRESSVVAACKDPGCGPSVIAFVSYGVPHLAAAGEALQAALRGAPRSPLLHLEYADTLNRMGKNRAALKQVRLAVAADPVNVPARVAQALALASIGQVVEAKLLMRDLTDCNSGLGIVQSAAADIAHQDGCLEAALVHATAARESAPDRPESLRGVIQELGSLGDIAAAEQEVYAGIEQWPGDRGLRLQEAACALAEGRRHEALSRLKRARSTGDRASDIFDVSKEIRRWLLRHPGSALVGGKIDDRAAKRLTERAEGPYRGRDRIPNAGHTRITGLLRQLDWDAARSYELALWGCLAALLPLAIGAVVVVNYAPNWITHIAGFPHFSYYYGPYDLLMLTLTIYLLWKRGITIYLSVICIATIATTVYSAIGHLIATWRYSGAILDVVVDVAFTALIVSTGFLVVGLGRRITHIWERHAARRHPTAALISSLLELSALLTDELLADSSGQLYCLRLIEDAAQAQERALNQALGEGTGRADPMIAEQARRWAARTAAATRRFKEEILAPGASTATSLSVRIDRLLETACSGHWEELATEEPPPKRQRARARLVHAIRTFVIAAMPAVILAIYQIWIRPLEPQSLHQPSGWAQALCYVIWPLTTVIWRLDPDAPAKAGALAGILHGGTGSATTGNGARPPSVQSDERF